MLPGSLKQICVGDCGVWGVSPEQQVWFRINSHGDPPDEGTGKKALKVAPNRQTQRSQLRRSFEKSLGLLNVELRLKKWQHFRFQSQALKLAAEAVRDGVDQGVAAVHAAVAWATLQCWPSVRLWQ